jgi:hypothetical protein
MEFRKMGIFQNNIRHDSRETESWHRFDYIVGVVTAEKEQRRLDNTVPEREKMGLPKKKHDRCLPCTLDFQQKKIMNTNDLPIVDL